MPYKLALALKELGFNLRCFTFYNKKRKLVKTDDWAFGYDLNDVINPNWEFSCLAPTYQQVFRWFRKKYKLYPEICLHDMEDIKTWRFGISVLGKYELAYNQNVRIEPYHKTYEKAELECLKKLIEIVKEKK